MITSPGLVDPESIRFRYFSQIQIWTLATGKSPVSSVKYQDENNKIVLILTALLGWTLVIIKSPMSISVGHPQFNYCRCPNLNLREISECESEANSTHLV